VGLSLSELVRPRTKDEFRALFLDALKGLGFVAKSGTGTGSLTASGNPTVTAAVLVEILTAGEPNVATFRYSLDGGATWAASGIVVPAIGTYVLVGTGVTLEVRRGAGGLGDLVQGRRQVHPGAVGPELPGHRVAAVLRAPDAR
jgi:hypothetical protein